MLIVILFLLAIISVAILILDRNKLYFLIAGLYISCILMFMGLILFFAKSGGLSDSQQLFLFITKGIQNRIKYTAISLDTIGYLVVIGRSLFPLFLLLIAMNYSMIDWIRSNRVIYKIATIPSIIFLIIFYPANYRVWFKGYLILQKSLNKLVLWWILLYIALAIILFVHEYSKITINFIKRKFGYIAIAQISITIFYILFAIDSPIYIFQPHGYEYLWGKYSYINPNISLDKWFLISGIVILLLIFGAINLANTHINYDDKDEDKIMKRRVNTAGEVVSIFIHGIKNQLIALKLLSRNIKKLVEVDDANDIDLDKLKDNARKLGTLTEQMTERMEELHKCFKSKTITLQPIEIEEVVKKAYSKFSQKYQVDDIEITYENNNTILADIDHLSEAVYNLMVNGYEALLRCSDDRNKKLNVYIQSERLYNVIVIKDNGIGMDSKKRRKIFEPFYTDKNTNQNWGMGLYYVRKIAKYHFGFTRVESKVGEGTTFYVMLPKYGR